MNWTLLKNSLMVAGGSAIAATLLGAAVAVWLMAMPAGVRRSALAFSVVALALPPFLVTNCWLDLLGQTGAWRGFLPLNIYSLWGTVWVLALMLWPIAVFFVVGSLRKLTPNQLDMEPDLRGWAMIRWLVIPMSRSALVQAAILVFVLALNNFAVPAILQTKVFPAELWVSFNTTFDYASALRLSWPLVVFPLVLLSALRNARVAWPRTQGGVGHRHFRERLGFAPLGLVAAVSGAVFLLAVAVPLGDLFVTRRTWSELPDAFSAGHSAVGYSLLFAILGASVCLGAGLLMWRWRAGVGFWLPFFMPGVLLGIALIFLLNRPPMIAFYQSAGVVVLALGVRYAALSWAGARHAITSLDARLVDFARLNGANRWQLFWHVRWPQIAPELGAVWLVTYLLCLWDAETIVLIIPPGCETLALRIFNLLHYGHNAQVNALCVILLGIALLPLLVWTVAEMGKRKAGVIVAGLLLAAVSGCQQESANEVPIQSKLFSSVQVIGSRGTALGQFNKPRSLALDAHDNLYVVDMTGRVQKFSSNGVYLLSWQMPQTELGKPKGMCRDTDGNIVVVEPHYNRATHFSPDGKLIARWGQPGTNEGQLCIPRAVAADRQGNIYVCEYTQVERVQRFTHHGERATLAFGQSGRSPGEFNRPEGLAVDAQNRVYVADSCNHRIQVFSSEGKFIREYGHAGNGMGQLSYPYDVQVDATGLQFVAEFGNSRIQVFDQRGASVEILGGPGAAPGRLSNPWSLALDSAGNLYVADSQNHRVQKFLRRTPLARKDVEHGRLVGLGRSRSDFNQPKCTS